MATTGIRIVLVGLVVGLLVSSTGPVAGVTHAPADGRTVDHEAVAPDTETETRQQNESFDFDVQQVQQCGTRCRLISAQLTNQMNESANRTRRIQIEFQKVLQTAGNDGYVEITANVTWSTGNATFRTREQVV